MPSPLLTVARAEFALLARRRSYRVLLAGFVALVVLAAVLGALRHGRERERQAEFQALVRAQWDGQPDRHPHRVAHYGTFAFKPVGPLAAFDPGVESHAGRIQFLEAHRQNAANFAEAGALSSAFRLGELSPAFILQTLLPLLVIVLGHGLVAGDRESGRARLALAQGVAPRAWIAGKALGLAAAAAPFLLVGSLAAFAEAGLAHLPRAALVAAALLLHTAGWITLAVLVSAHVATAARALGALVAAWALATVVVPRAAAAWAAHAHPLPTKSDFTARLEKETHRLGDSHNPDDPVFARLRAETLARHGVARLEDLPVNYGAVVMARGEELGAEVFARHYAELAAIMERQESLVRAAGIVAPVLALRAVSAAASGTDLLATLAFQREAEAYRFAFVQKLNELHRDKVRRENDRDQRLSADHWRAFPDFRATSPSWSEALAGTAGSWALLAAWALLPLAALLRRKEVAV